MKLLITTQVVDKEDPILGFFHDWLEEFAKHFESISVICLKEGVHELPQNITVYSLGKESGENHCKYIFRFYKFFGKIFFCNRVDFVFFHMGAVYNLLAIPFFLVRKLRGTQFYWWKAHGHINITGRLAGVFTDRIYTASENSFPVQSKKKVVVGHGIRVCGEELIKKEIKNNVRLVSVGRITRIKNIEQVIELGNMLYTRNIPFTILIIGPIIDMAYHSDLENLIHSYSLSNFITMAGPKNKNDLQEVYRNTDVLIHTSKTGSVDKVVLEAMSHGVVPIAPFVAYGDILQPFHLCVKEDTGEAYFHILNRLRHMKIDEYNMLRVALQNAVIKGHSLATLTQRIFNI